MCSPVEIYSKYTMYYMKIPTYVKQTCNYLVTHSEIIIPISLHKACHKCGLHIRHTSMTEKSHHTDFTAEYYWSTAHQASLSGKM